MKKKNSFLLFPILLMLFALISANNAAAQTLYEYWVAFTENGPYRAAYQPSNINYEIKVINPNSTAVNVTVSGGGISGAGGTVNAGSSRIFKLTEAQVTAVFQELPATSAVSGIGDATSSKGVIVSASSPILVSAMTQVPLSADVTNLLETGQLGTEYYCINYKAPNTAAEFGSFPYTPKSGYMIIATEAGGTNVYENGIKKATLAGRGSTYYRYSYFGDMTGTHITTSRPTACIAMSTVATVPDGSYNGDALLQQIPPITQWGRKFAIPLPSGLLQNRIRVVAVKNGTDVKVTGAVLARSTGANASLIGLGAGEFVELELTGPNGCYIEANQPVGVCSFFTGFRLNGGNAGNPSLTPWSGDPAQAWVPPLEQIDHEVRVSAFQPNRTINSGTFIDPNRHYALVIVPTATKKQTTGPAGLTTAAWKEIPGSGYSFCQVALGSDVATPPTYLFDNPGGVIVGAFGVGPQESYYYYSGFKTKNLTLGFTVNGDYYFDMDGKVYCDISDFVFKTVSDTLTSVVWKLNGSEIAADPVKPGTVRINLPDGYYTIAMTNYDTTYTTRFFAGGSSAIWTPDNNTAGTEEQKRDWNTADNWTPAVIPTGCNNVYIPGNLEYYPQLTSAAECRNIYFMQGGELGRPDLLTYKRAYVQFNFGLMQSPYQIKDENQDLVLKSGASADRMRYSAAVSADSLLRERWYMLTAPLRGTVTGDLGFGGFPLTFLMKFGPVNKGAHLYNVGQWTTPYTEMTEPLSCTDGFAYYMYGYGMTTSDVGCDESGVYGALPELNEFPLLPAERSGLNYGLGETNGILELPFFEDTTNLNAHRTQVYDPVFRQSIFYSVYDGKNGSVLNALTSNPPESVIRENNDGNYRFAPEIRSGGKWVFQNPVTHSEAQLVGDDEFMVGNPYMSSIDMIAFIRDNTGTLQPQYRLWNGTTFISYMVDLGNNTVICCDPGEIDPGYVAPLQGFFLRTVNPYTKTGSVASFDVTKISTVRPGGAFSLRSKTPEQNRLRIKAENDKAASYLLIGYKEDAADGFRSGEDGQKLFSPVEYVPEIYALADETPTDILFVNNKKTMDIPLGIKTDRTGKIRLTFTGMDNYTKASKIELNDALGICTADLTGKPSYTCTFDLSEAGISNGRFSLRIVSSITGLPDTNDSDALKVYGDSKGIYVISPASDPVQQMAVYDFQGRKIYESTSDARYYPLPGNLGRSPLIVKVTTMNMEKIVKINP